MMKRNLVVVAAVSLLSAPAGVVLAEPTIHSFLWPELPAFDAQHTTLAQRGTVAGDRAEFVGTAARTPAEESAKPHRIPDRLVNTNP
jgi:hypothetical protein